jgi:ribose 5-phosphate isomerase B
MKIIIGADHGGYELKNSISEWLKTQNHEVEDVGVFNSDSVDYPDISQKVGLGVSSGDFQRGILICGSGVGVNIAVNKINGIRAVHCHDTVIARLSREHNNTNVITMGGRFIAKELAFEILQIWLNTDFASGRHQNRVDKISALESN